MPQWRWWGSDRYGAGQEVSMDERSIDEQVSEWIERGRNLRGCGYPARAIPLFLRALRLDPDHAKAREELESTRAEVRRLQAAVSQCETRLASNPSDRKALLKLADALVRLDRDDEARAALQQVLACDDEDAEALFDLGHLLNNSFYYEEALTAFRRLAKVEPDWAHPLACQGMVLCNMRRYEEALPILDQAIALDPNDICGWTEKVRALRALGREQEARRAYEQERVARRASGVLRWMPRGEMN
jgi:tetratricopeptide (TPR) repeat protein